jgi:hypothetical protein
MRLARLAAVGLAFGVIAGFAIALLRPRAQARPGASNTDPSHAEPWANSEPGRRDRSHRSDRSDRTTDSDRATDEPSVLDVRGQRRVTG